MKGVPTRTTGATGNLAARLGAASPRLLSLLTAAVAALDLSAALHSAAQPPVAWIEAIYPLGAAGGQPRLLAACSAFLLVQLALGLWRRKRLAWSLAVLLVTVSGLHQALGLGNAMEGLLSSILVLLFWCGRHHFIARSDPPSVRQGLQVLLAALGFTVLYGLLGFLWIDQAAGVPFRADQSALQTVALFFAESPAAAGGPAAALLTSRLGRDFVASINSLGLITVAYALVLLLRPVMQRNVSSAQDLKRARSIVARHGLTPLACMALMGEKALLFSASGRSCLAYGVRGRGAIALGDPVGLPEEMPELIAAFCRRCRTNDWIPAFYQVRPDGLRHYRDAGFRATVIGDEAIVELPSFTLRGAAGKNLRPAVNKFKRLGYRVEIAASATPELIERLRPISDDWLQRMGGREKCFSVGRFEGASMHGASVALLCDAGGDPVAFITLLKVAEGDEVAADLMRSRTALPSGAMDALLAGIMEHLQAQGVQRFNLGLCALRRVGEHPDATLEEKALGRLSQHLEQFYGFRGLQAYKAKFHPRWQPRYLVYPNLANLSEVLTALIRLESAGRIRHLVTGKHSQP